MADRQEIAEAIAAGLARGEFAGLSKADIYHRFQDRGASRATVYRAIDDGIRLATERGISVQIEAPTNQWAPSNAAGPEPAGDMGEIDIPLPPAPAPAAASDRQARTETFSDDAMVDLAQVRQAIGDVGKAISGAAMRDGRTFSEGVACIGRTVARLRQVAGGGEAADRIIAGLISALRDDPASAGRLTATFGHFGG